MQLRQFRLEQCFADGQLSQFSLEAHLREMIPWDFPRRGWVYIGIAASWVPGGHILRIVLTHSQRLIEFGSVFVRDRCIVGH